jgi:uncharacterized protein (DUF488 family)
MMTDLGTGIYTIGHSTQSIERFTSLLASYRITAIADVRSSPYSRRNPQFNREALKADLAKHGIQYVFLGAELGGRGDESTRRDEHGRVLYREMASTSSFRRGLRRVRDGGLRMRVALLCAEADPLLCHRGLLISRELVRDGAPVIHIHPDGHREDHAAAEQRLLTMTGVPQSQELFRSEEQALDDAYAHQEVRVAYVAPGHAEWSVS